MEAMEPKPEAMQDNPVLQCIMTRRSIRRFEARQIDDTQLTCITTAAAYAPSGSNGQSWRFTVIQNPDILALLNEEVRSGFSRLSLSNNEYPAKISAKLNARKASYNFFYHAPTLIIASNIPHYQNAMADCAAAIENMMLAASALGLGSCWINQLTWLSGDETLRQYLSVLGIPKNHVICGACAIGYPAETPSPAPRRPDTVFLLK